MAGVSPVVIKHHEPSAMELAASVTLPQLETLVILCKSTWELDDNAVANMIGALT
jgi:hypothetical protein